MPLRTIRSQGGRWWKVWNVVPGARHDDERRRGYDRRSPEPVILHPGPERRSAEDRRAETHLVAPELRNGWLVFDDGGRRWRVAPVPPHWETMPDPALVRLCSGALPRPDESGSHAPRVFRG